MAPRRAVSARVIQFDHILLRTLRRQKGYRSAQALVSALQAYPECENLIEDLVYKWENGTRPEVAYMLALVREFGVPFEDWFTWPGK